MFKVATDRGRIFNVRFIFKGDFYGLDFCLKYDDPKPMVEFYDATYANQKPWGPWGQFVSSYFCETFLECPGQGVDLYGGEPVWRLDARAADKVREYILTNIPIKG